jgi:hypothetical protein
MSVDVLGLFNNASNIVLSAILILGIYRALQMRGAFVNPAYRSRATGSVFLMLLLLITFLTIYAPFPSSGALSVIGFLPFLAVILTFFVYADRSVLVAIETDFFHRNTLRWFQVRWPAGLALVAAVALLVLTIVFLPAFNGFPPPDYPVLGLVAFFMFLAVIPLVLAYSTAALIVGARRSSDKTLRRSILLLGLALSTLVLDLVLTSPFTQGTLPYVVVSNGTAVVGIYLIYRSVMSLSPLGRVEKEAAQNSKPIESSVLLSGNS